MTYKIPDPLPWAQLAGPLAAAEDSLARLDERLATSPIREGFVARTHFADACASLWLDGELVALEDLVLRDAQMAARAATLPLIRATSVLATRRRIGAEKPDWALTPAGLEVLRGRISAETGQADRAGGLDAAENDEAEGTTEDLFEAGGAPPGLTAAVKAVEAALSTTARTLATQAGGRAERDPLVYDLDWDEDARLAEWRALVEETKTLPATLAAALALDAWTVIDPLQHRPWLGRLLAAALLRERGKTRSHLACLNEGLKAIPREKRRPRDPAGRLVMQLAALTAAAEAGRKAHERWILARTLMAGKLEGRRLTSRLPALLEFVLSRPLVSAGMIAKELKITPRAAQDLVAELGLRELTGRGRWGACRNGDKGKGTDEKPAEMIKTGPPPIPARPTLGEVPTVFTVLFQLLAFKANWWTPSAVVHCRLIFGRTCITFLLTGCKEFEDADRDHHLKRSDHSPTGGPS